MIRLPDGTDFRENINRAQERLKETQEILSHVQEDIREAEAKPKTVHTRNSDDTYALSSSSNGNGEGNASGQQNMNRAAEFSAPRNTGAMKEERDGRFNAYRVSIRQDARVQDGNIDRSQNPLRECMATRRMGNEMDNPSSAAAHLNCLELSGHQHYGDPIQLHGLGYEDRADTQLRGWQDDRRRGGPRQRRDSGFRGFLRGIGGIMKWRPFKRDKKRQRNLDDWAQLGEVQQDIDNLGHSLEQVRSLRHPAEAIDPRGLMPEPDEGTSSSRNENNDQGPSPRQEYQRVEWTADDLPTGIASMPRRPDDALYKKIRARLHVIQPWMVAPNLKGPNQFQSDKREPE
ncbi:hypothetical protein MKZ38_005031 [Zalerion maritima]|uniref:Uncharacterized protein n=1 Tax=Zalerion maritima TaxID=339359 RepID=A0AAD5RL01_9PEZI|nr:hypothetical protein MKZ38_005031 [Zalerion maritima]